MQSSAHQSGHPTPLTYAKIASILAIITAIEFGIFYVPDYAPGLKSTIVPAFVILSAVKFALVAMFYMHLKFDERLFSGFFVGGLLLATTVILALLALFAIVSGDRIVVAVPEETAVDAHGADSTTTTDTTTTTDAGTDTQMTLSADFTHEIGSAASDDLTFDQDSLSASAGQEITLRFNNNAVTQQHNWVLVQSGTKDEVAAAGLVDPVNWLDPNDPNVIASVQLLNPGEAGEVTFTAPAAGNYEFVCTFPGHNLTMFGTFEVTP